MLSPKTRLMLQDILARLSRSEEVSLKERILVQKYADRNSTVDSWLRKARSIQRKGHLEQGSISGFMQNLNLAGQDPMTISTIPATTSVTGFKDHQDGFAAVDGPTLISTAVR